MNDDELRALVRDAIARQMGGSTRPPANTPASSLRLHASHGMFSLLTDGASDDGPCVIEPAVMCNHCGYCKSYGH